MMTRSKAKKTETLYDQFPLGDAKETHISMDTHKTQRNNNILVIGGTGAGKTLGTAYPMLMHLKHGNAVGIFTKRDLTRPIGKLLKKRGYRIIEIDLCHPEKSPYGYDPLRHCHEDADISALAHSIICSSGKQSHLDTFWNDSAESLLVPVLRYVARGAYKGGKGLKAALKLLDSIPGTVEDHWEGIYDTISADRELAQRKLNFNSPKLPWDISNRYVHKTTQIERSAYMPDTANELLLHELFAMTELDPSGMAAWAAVAKGADQTSKSIMLSLMMPLSFLFTNAVRRLFDRPRAFSFNQLLQPKTVVFVYTSPVNPAQHRFAGLFYQQLFKRLFEMAEKRPSGVLPEPVYVICDDFATGAPIQNFPQLISIFRAKGISATMLIQSETQLASLYGFSEAQTIINNCDTQIYLGGMDIATCKNVASRVDWPYQEVLNMPIGQELFFRRGQKPIVTKRYDFFGDPLYASLEKESRVSA